MRKLLYAIVLIAFFIAGPVYGATYFGCANAAINADSTFEDAAACDGTPASGATIAAGGHVLYANGYTITYPEALVMSQTTMANTGGGSTDGGQFTVTTTGWTNETTALTVGTLTTGGTTGPVLAISGSGTGDPATDPIFTLTVTNCNAGSAAAMYCVGDTHTVGRVNATITTCTAGSNASAHCYYYSSATANALALNGNFVGSATSAISACGVYGAGSGAFTVGAQSASTCTGGSGHGDAAGCYAYGTTNYMTFTGNAVDNRGKGYKGYVYYTPAANNWIRVTTGSGTYVYLSPGLASDNAGTAIAAADTAANVKDGTFFVKKDDGVTTEGTYAAAGGGGGAYAY